MSKQAPQKALPVLQEAPCCVPTLPVRPPQDLGPLAKALKALADPTRLEMVVLLAQRKEPLCVCEIENHFALSQPTISHHLRQLREAELLQAERRGTWVYYSLAPSGLSSLRRLISLLSL